MVGSAANENRWSCVLERGGIVYCLFADETGRVRAGVYGDPERAGNCAVLRARPPVCPVV